MYHLSSVLAVPPWVVGGLQRCIGGTKRFFFFLGRLPKRSPAEGDEALVKLLFEINLLLKCL